VALTSADPFGGQNRQVTVAAVLTQRRAHLPQVLERVFEGCYVLVGRAKGAAGRLAHLDGLVEHSQQALGQVLAFGEGVSECPCGSTCPLLNG